MRKMTLFRLIATATTHFIYLHLPKYHITNVYRKLNFAPMQIFLKIHCLLWKKTPFCLKQGYFGAFNMGSDYLAFLFIRHGT